MHYWPAYELYSSAIDSGVHGGNKFIKGRNIVIYMAAHHRHFIVEQKVFVFLYVGLWHGPKVNIWESLISLVMISTCGCVWCVAIDRTQSKS